MTKIRNAQLVVVIVVVLYCIVLYCLGGLFRSQAGECLAFNVPSSPIQRIVDDFQLLNRTQRQEIFHSVFGSGNKLAMVGQEGTNSSRPSAKTDRSISGPSLRPPSLASICS